jgi:hypothetical protein
VNKKQHEDENPENYHLDIQNEKQLPTSVMVVYFNVKEIIDEYILHNKR